MSWDVLILAEVIMFIRMVLRDELRLLLIFSLLSNWAVTDVVEYVKANSI